MDMLSRLGIAIPVSTALALGVLYGLDTAGIGNDGDTPPPPPPPHEDEPDNPPAQPPEDETGDEPEDNPDDAPLDPVDPPVDPVDPPEEPELPAEPVPLDFPHNPPGDLLQTTIEYQDGSPSETGSSAHEADEGYTDPLVFAPDMRFPFLRGPAYANSQIFLPTQGAAYYPARDRDEDNNIVDIYIDGVRYARPWGPQNSPINFAYPWIDNYCEIRYSDVSRCTGTDGHQGQDIRPGSCTHNHVIVAAADGRLESLSNLSMDLYADDGAGTVYRYLHVDRPLLVDIPENGWIEVEKGQPLGFASNISNSSMSRLTTVHLHFEIWLGTPGGTDPLPPYTSLVESYRMLGAEDPTNHDPLPAIGDCSYPDGGLTPTRQQVLDALGLD